MHASGVNYGFNSSYHVDSILERFYQESKPRWYRHNAMRLTRGGRTGSFELSCSSIGRRRVQPLLGGEPLNFSAVVAQNANGACKAPPHSA
jgi:hypothetical protein